MESSESSSVSAVGGGLVLEVGKRYVTRGGRVTSGLLMNTSGDKDYCFWCNELSRSWKPNGVWCSEDQASDFDLVREWVPEPAVEVAAVKPDYPPGSPTMITIPLEEYERLKDRVERLREAAGRVVAKHDAGTLARDRGDSVAIEKLREVM